MGTFVLIRPAQTFNERIKVGNIPYSGAPFVASGFIYHVDDEGAAYILTNQHVVDEAQAIAALVGDSMIYEAEVLNVDTRRDIALLSICCDEFKAVAFADSTELMPGDEVISLGYPRNWAMPSLFRRVRVTSPLEVTLTKGIISAFRYSSLMDAELVQTDAAVNPGNSGGPLFSAVGLVVGINTMGVRDSKGLNFAVSETTVRKRLRLWDVGTSADFGPLSGSLRHDSDSYYEAFSPFFTADSDEFVVHATLTNPWTATSLRKWSYGIRFGWTGQANDPHMLFVVHSSKRWYLYMRDAAGNLQQMHRGTVPQLHTRSGQKNHLSLFVDGRFGDLYVNAQRARLPDRAAQHINLGDTLLTSHEGSVAVVTGLWPGHERPGYRTRYENFMGWTYDHQAE